MISIIIPIYNQANKLSKCLDSILKQSYKNYEVIVVDDASKDDVVGVINKYKKLLNVNCYRLNVNSGAPAARNKGFKESRGEYLLFCDADVILEQDVLETMLNALNKHFEASYAYSSFLWGRKLFKLWPFDAEKLKQMPYIHSTSLIRRAHFPSNGWDESIKKLQDWDLWLTMLKQRHTGVWVDKILFKAHPKGTMSSWLPSFAYKLMPFLPSVKRYKKAVEIIKKKHCL